MVRDVWQQKHINQDFLNFSIFFLSSVKALSMESLVLAPVKTTFPDAKMRADLTCSICLQTTPGKFSLRTTFLSSQSLPMSILQPRSALATILVTWKSTIFNLVESDFWISLMERLAACSASDSDSEPMMIMRPDLKTRMVLLGLVLRMITAGNLFLLYLLPSTFSAISLRSRSLSMLILAKETTFCTSGRLGCSWIFYIPLKQSIKILEKQGSITTFLSHSSYGFQNIFSPNITFFLIQPEYQGPE